TGDNPIEAFASAAFKRSNNNLEFSGTGEEGQINKTSTDIVQVTLGTSAIWRDKKGAWAASLSATGSPGRLTPYNNDRYFAGVMNAGGTWDIDFARYGSKAQYAYASLALQRYQMMPFGCELTVRGAFQASTANLLPSEQFSLGGSTTVRGYPESVGGDKGYVINTELITPTWRYPLPGKLSKLDPLEARALFFFDFGDTAEYTQPSRLPQPPLASAGFGIRAALPGRMSLTADYGFQLTELRSVTPQRTIMTSGDIGRGHVKLVIAF
ncbi:MAG TPA: ShlB/FhaC/HecB family hemolysin secretion/activation protein, partial [Opitutaceae bacterium]